MKMSNRLLVMLLGLLVFGAAIGAVAYNRNQKQAADKLTMQREVAESSEKMPAKDAAVMTKDSDKMAHQSDAMTAGGYTAYDSARLASAKNGKVVIFFAASWCPECRKLDKSITQNLGAIPKGTTILKADYDKETSLKQKYGVTYQHTLVQVDENGTMLKKWSGSSSLDDLLSKVI